MNETIVGGRRDHSLDLLKILATLVIVLHHYERAFGIHFDTWNFGNGAFNFGHAVELFFIISGYLSYSKISKIQNGLSFGRYFSAKYLRLVPLTVLCSALTAIYALYVWHGDNFSLLRVLMVAFCVFTGRNNGQVFFNSHLWYLGVLLICYAVFYMIIYLSQRLRINWRYACFFVIITGVSVHSAGWDVPFLNPNTARGYMAFFTGLMLASGLEERRPTFRMAVSALLVVVFSTLILIFRYDLLDYGIIYFLTFIYYPALIVFFEFAPVGKLFDHRFFGTAAGICFNVYIWHFEFNTFCAIEVERHGWGIDFCSRKAEIIMLLLSIAIGAFSFYVIERPLTKLIRKNTGRLFQ